MEVMAQPVLLLNASYEPVLIASAKRAMILLVKGVACVEESRNIRIHRDWLLPSVVRLREYRKVPHRIIVVSRKNVYIRDGYTCLYCGRKFAADKLTLDHIVPRSRGGKSRWENLATACADCNRRKGDQTPEEAGMPLLKVPRAVTLATHKHVMRQAGQAEQAWRKYLYF